jgi:hypothetical protein
MRIRNVLWWLLVAALLWLSDWDRRRGADAVEVIGCQGPGGEGRLAQPRLATRNQLRPLTSVCAIANAAASGNAAAATGSSAIP